MQVNRPIEIFSTCPQSSIGPGETYVERVIEVARWSERHSCKGMLVYADNSLVDPWLIAQLIIQATTKLCPLVAVQPVYMHPYAVAKMVGSLAHLFGRRIYLNMIAGGFKNDLVSLKDNTPHDRRYDRLIEYTLIIKQLLGGGTVSYAGEYYQVDKLKLTPRLPPELFPGILISGSSEAGLAAAEAIGAVAIKYPQPATEYENSAADCLKVGIRVGIIAREASKEAWRIAWERFPEDRRGELTHQLAMKTSDSAWHKQLSEIGEGSEASSEPYWLHPFNSYKTFCPYLVGSYDRVAAELDRYVQLGNETFILDVPPNEEELLHTNVVFSWGSTEAAL